MSWFKKPFGPFRVPAGPVGDAFIDFLCKIHGISKEDARKAGEESMRTKFRMGPIIPRPFKAPVGAIMLMDINGRIDKEAVEAATLNNEDRHTMDCLGFAARFLKAEENIDAVREVSVRHYYSTRYVLEMAEKWIDVALLACPELKSFNPDDVKWAIKTVIEGADEDLEDLKRVYRFREKKVL